MRHRKFACRLSFSVPVTFVPHARKKSNISIYICVSSASFYVCEKCGTLPTKSSASPIKRLRLLNTRLRARTTLLSAFCVSKNSQFPFTTHARFHAIPSATYKYYIYAIKLSATHCRLSSAAIFWSSATSISLPSFLVFFFFFCFFGASNALINLMCTHVGTIFTNYRRARVCACAHHI